MSVLLCCGRRTLIARKAMRRRINETAEMSATNYYKEEAKDFALRTSDSGVIPQYADFEVTKPVSPDRLPLNPSSQNLMTENKSGETMSTQRRLPGNYNTAAAAATSNPPRVGLPSGPSPYGGGGYPPAVRMPRPPHPGPPPRSRGNEGGYVAGPPPPPLPPPGTIPGVLPGSRSNASLNSMNRRPPSRHNYDNQYPLPPPAAAVDRHASSIYSDYVPPRRQWGSLPTESQSLQDGPLEPLDREYRPERPKIDTSNLANRNPPLYPQRLASPIGKNRRASETGGSMIASYYEDVDPRFDDTPDEELESADAYRPVAPLTTRNPHLRSDLVEQDRYSPIERNYSLGKDGDEGPRSPAASTSSHFTSVSQRGVNPRWQPGPQQGGYGGEYGDGYARRNRAPRNDQMNFLSGNPDFELPVSRSGRRNGPGGIGGTGIDMGSRYPVPR